jgi:hypothetical protein
MTIPVHPLVEALALPRLAGDEREAFVASIAEQGVLRPVLLWQGHLVDGQERQDAVAVLARRGVVRDLPTEEWDGEGSLVALVLGLNLHRRHLDGSIRAALAARVPDALEEEARRRPEAARWLAELVPPLETPAKTPKSPQAWAAGVLQVSERYVRMARQVEEQGSAELAKAVKEGKVSVRRATRLAELPAEEQLAAIAGQGQKARATNAAGHIRDQFGRSHRHWTEGAGHVARAVLQLTRALACFRKAQADLTGFDAANLLARLAADADLATRCRDQIAATGRQITAAGERLALRKTG